MGQRVSKDELLHQQVNYGLEFRDGEGKTPLIAACLRRDLLPVAKLLIELGANVDAYRPGSHAGTPFHHAAKKGLEQTVHILLSNGANPYIMNDDGHTALDLAREKGFHNVIRAIESRVSLFSGWLREFYGPSFLKELVPQLLSRKVWAVVLPCDFRNPTKPAKFELALYTDLQVAKPCTVISLWKANVEEPKLNQADPAVIIVEKNTRKRYKFLSAPEGDKQQLQWFYNACRGILQMHSSIPATTVGASVPNHSVSSYASTASKPIPIPKPALNPEDIELAMAINASIQSDIAGGVTDVNISSMTSRASMNEPNTYNRWAVFDSRPSTSMPHLNVHTTNDSVTIPATVPSAAASTPSAPPIAEDDIIHYPSIDSTPVDSNNLGTHIPTVFDSRPSTSMPHLNVHTTNDSVTIPATVPSAAASAPSAPPIAEDDIIHYPSIDSTPVDSNNLGTHIPTGAPPSKEGSSSGISRLETSVTKSDNNSISSCCVICLGAPVEGACIPCGHMAGCMSCLKEIETKHGECPICRTKINLVIKLYAV